MVYSQNSRRALSQLNKLNKRKGSLLETGRFEENEVWSVGTPNGGVHGHVNGGEFTERSRWHE